ncbi:EAL domain-containing protein [Pseudanabaena mucicola]|uniref:EAL domain-containing protein n=1 Tax=Pseudanabaena mucicola FACHB-723 TaxID=2692860 RepID=A0ABR8A2A9_9CYAN|nr:EAL domain-containing protein [Pseudanabaena mucicola]MBD2189477.1 EAL domain-containing protein [Pseudanabaena mucicola FACHB-723]
MVGDQNNMANGCTECSKDRGLGFEFTMAFQPIVNTTTHEVFAQEALVRGLNEEPAGEILGRVNDLNRYSFDQSCRVKAVEFGAKLDIKSFVSINFLPNAVYRPELCIRTTIEAAETFGFPVNQIIFEVTEGEKITDHAHLREIIQYYRKTGFLTAIDDFGAGYSGLNLLAEMQTDLVKIDMGLIRDIDHNKSRRAIVRGITQVCDELGIKVIAEGIETYEELSILQSFGIELFQGFYFAKPMFQNLATIKNL